METEAQTGVGPRPGLYGGQGQLCACQGLTFTILRMALSRQPRTSNGPPFPSLPALPPPKPHSTHFTESGCLVAGSSRGSLLESPYCSGENSPNLKQVLVADLEEGGCDGPGCPDPCLEKPASYLMGAGDIPIPCSSPALPVLPSRTADPSTELRLILDTGDILQELLDSSAQGLARVGWHR